MKGLFYISKWYNYEFIINNVLGEKVYEASSPSERFIRAGLKGGKHTIDLSSRPNGIYFIQVKTNEGIVNKKIIISK